MAGLKRLFVDKTGDIYRCTQTVGGKIGNIFGEYEMPEKEIICNVTYCPCKLDAIIEKWKEPIRA
jgi:radical SAM protein with 4Fe4S-binding SPASM domain